MRTFVQSTVDALKALGKTAVDRLLVLSVLIFLVKFGYLTPESFETVLEHLSTQM